MRGMVLDKEGNIIGRPMKKFFNIEELQPSEIPFGEDFEVFEKMDGSLGIVFYYNNEWHIATRGSFNSEQAIKGKEILKKYNTKLLTPGYTYLFEIIYPENRIVLDYGKDEKLVLLGKININGKEKPIYFYKEDGFEVVKKYDGLNDFKQIKSIINPNQEGFVLKFESGFRMKIKGDEYCRLHKLKDNITDKYIWECLSTKTEIDISNLPDEWDNEIKKIISKFRYYFYQVREEVGKTFDYKMWGKYNDLEPETDRKKFAEWVKQQPKHFHSIYFRKFDGKDYDDIIWKMLKP